MPLLFFDVMYGLYPDDDWEKYCSKYDDLGIAQPIKNEQDQLDEQFYFMEQERQWIAEEDSRVANAILEEEKQKRLRSQSIHDRIVAALEEEKRRLSTNTI